ncbi:MULTISPECIES: hypothetical protein [unclassified Fusibacter]|uniref:hypothetical protein n=1 Tax=unclassified Fusibacter TaxID=2624464 RepID=UPI0010121026|nr:MULTISPECIES: hypothetical protein [unclassified Fusibacter]MCK8059989.1 hypothetical protein [Fusibacter sp. A2]NPE22129.1 hypothetical protein [Fusibacter sp. A1]RXV60907.1 hypothetical protein DWB64_09810 [Fusibacter sp. A1]
MVDINTRKKGYDHMTYEVIKKKFNTSMYTKLVVAILIDILGYVSYLVPFLAEISDIIWAPISAIIIFIMFRKQLIFASTGAIVGFAEEIMTGTDAVPSATLIWVGVYVFNRDKTFKKFSTRELKDMQLVEDLTSKYK